MGEKNSLFFFCQVVTEKNRYDNNTVKKHFYFCCKDKDFIDTKKKIEIKIFLYRMIIIFNLT